MSDLIYKQDAKDAVDMALDTIDHVPEWVYDILLNSLDKLPSASPDLSEEDMRLIKKLRSFHNGSYAVVLDKLITSACNENKQQATGSSDCIYRKDAIDAMAEELLIFPIGLTEAYDVAENALSGLPSVEPERKKGYWIKKEPTIKELHGCYYECSKCHKFSLPFQKLNFCPNCGTDMREGEEE